jgi:hypothetical protein
VKINTINKRVYEKHGRRNPLNIPECVWGKWCRLKTHTPESLGMAAARTHKIFFFLKPDQLEFNFQNSFSTIKIF